MVRTSHHIHCQTDMDLADRNGRPASRTHCIGLIIIIISQIWMVNTWTWCRECCTPESNRHPGPRHQESAPPRGSQDRHCYGQPQGPSMTWNAGRLLKVAMIVRNNGLSPVLDLHLGEGDGDVEDAPHLLPPPHQQTRQHPRTVGLRPAPIRDQYSVLVSHHLTNQGSVF